MPVSSLQTRYQEVIAPKLKAEFNIPNNLAIPRMVKIVVNMGFGKAAGDKQRADDVMRELAQITGQRGVLTRARISVSNFKLRENMIIGAKVTLRRQRMFEFFERVVNLAIPRIRDFRGMSPSSFDGQGNYNFGLTEQTVFPEIDLNKVKFQQGMNITVCTTAPNDVQARRLLEEFGFPFAKATAANTAKAG